MSKKDLMDKFPYPFGFALDCNLCSMLIEKYNALFHLINDENLLEEMYYKFIEYSKQFFNDEYLKYRLKYLYNIEEMDLHKSLRLFSHKKKSREK